METAAKSFVRHNIVEVQAGLSHCTITQMFLRHQSPYDEMIGHEPSNTNNELLVPLGNYFDDKIKEIRH